MASVSSASPPPHSFPRAESDSDWEQIESNPSSVGFFPSPASGSIGSWQVVGYQNQVQASPPAVSPLNLDTDHQHGYAASYPDQPDTQLMTTTAMESNAMYAFNDQQIFSGQELLFPGQYAGAVDGSQYYPPYQNGLIQNDMAGIAGMDTFQVAPQPVDLGIPSHFRTPGDASPWGPTNLKNDETFAHWNGEMIPRETPRHSPSASSSFSSPGSPPVKIEPGKTPSPIRKVRPGGRIEKKRSEQSKFVIMTPNLINQQSGKPNPFECFEAMRTTQRGRKGPLANETKESALQVRRLGACFCCHSRKVKCDKERPCKNCKKMTTQVPQIMCWQFQDFLPILFPEFIRGHFRKEQVAAFLSDNVQEFGGEGQQCSVEFFSGTRFQSTLTVPASFFTAKTAEVLQHWHLTTGVNQIDLQSRGSAPIGIDPENNAQREELKKKSREYINNLTFEPMYAEQVTDSIRSTMVPRKVLGIVQRFAQQTNSPMVKRALSIYVMHYVLTRQLCLTQNSIIDLQASNMVSQNTAWVTTRVLNRQVKAMLDEMLLKEMQTLFDGFSKSLKPKSRKEWAPCLAAFLVLCLFMESVETAADTFVVSQNELSIRNRSQPEYQRNFALSLVKEIDNMPFKQFAYQFHQIYQTHTKDAATKAFNPLLDDSIIQQGELEQPGVDMVTGLRELIEGDGWHELDFLVADPILPNQETHPYPRDVSLNYTGRLIARFLLSFTDEKYLFDGQF